MKAKSVVYLSVLLALGLTPLRAEDDNLPPLAPPAPPAAPEVPRAPKPPKPDPFGEISAKTEEMARHLGAEARAAAEHARALALDVRRSFRRGGEANRTLVLPTEMGAPESLAAGHEDLSVMSRILKKAADRDARRPGYKTLSFSLGETGSNLDAMYLEGYGAVFLLNADYPLTAPPQPEAGKSAAQEEDSTWEKTRREVRGRGEEDDELFPDGEERDALWVEDGSSKYDADRVDALKRRLIEALKHGKNLRNLKDGEHLTVIVFGKSTGKRTRVSRVKTPKGENVVRSDDGESHSTHVSVNVVGYINTDAVRQSTLVIRARKADILRFAAGELNATDFARQLSVSAF